MRIPANQTLIPEGNRTAFRDEPEHSERSDAGNSIVRENVRLRQGKPVRSEAEGAALAGEGIRGKAAGLAPPQHTVTLERE